MEKTNSKFPYIVITGPESTGKTELAQFLAGSLHCDWIPELSRNYIANLHRPYEMNDVENIAKLQIEEFTKYGTKTSPFIIFDTGLIITKVWFDLVYNYCPAWLIKAIEQQPKVFHLICAADLPWIPDSVRENGGEMRNKLFELYKHELNSFGFPFEIVSGKGIVRFKNALKIVNEFVLF